MRHLLGALVFALLIGGQFLAVIAVHNMRLDGRSVEPRGQDADAARIRHNWLFG